MVCYVIAQLGFILGGGWLKIKPEYVDGLTDEVQTFFLGYILFGKAIFIITFITYLSPSFPNL